MRASHDLSRVSISFVEPSLVSHGGLVAPAELAQRLGVGELIDERVSLAGTPGAANVGINTMTMFGGMPGGADSTDDMDVMRAGATSDVFAVRAPSGVVFDHHAFITDRDGGLLALEAHHGKHAVIEKVIEDLKNGCGLVHLPSARFAELVKSSV